MHIKICFMLILLLKRFWLKFKTNLNLCMTKIHWNQIIHIHQNISVYIYKQNIFAWSKFIEINLWLVKYFFSLFKVDTKHWTFLPFHESKLWQSKKIISEIWQFYVLCNVHEIKLPTYTYTFFYHLITCLEHAVKSK